MPLNLIKLCVGCESVEDLADWQSRRPTAKQGFTHHRTRFAPKRDAEILDGGSLYWVIKGWLRVRQRILAFDDGSDPDGTPVCLIRLDLGLTLVDPRRFRAFQGWRYLTAKDAPADLPQGGDALPPGLAEELKELGLL